MNGPLTLPPCLRHLGLDLDADERAVRRAYARQVKELDQEQQAEQFQALREAYEAALAWCRSPRESHAEEAGSIATPEVHAAENEATPPAPPPPPARPSYAQSHARLIVPPQVPVFTAVAMPSWREEADRQWALLRERFRLLAASPEGQETVRWQGVLDEILGEDTWQDLRARPWLEQQIADLLAEGWHPGHQHLFEAAASQFRWHEDVTRLRALGRAGEMLGQALDQRQHFREQPYTQTGTMLQAMARLRDPREPEYDEKAYILSVLLPLGQRYPQWMSIVTSMANYERWCSPVEPPRPKVASSSPSPAELSFAEVLRRREERLQGCAILVFLLIVGFVGGVGWYGKRESGNETQRSESLSHYASHYDDARYAEQLASVREMMATFEIEKLTLLRLAYTPAAGSGELRARYRLRFFAGKLTGQELLVSSGDPVFDQAVRHALAQVPAFPADLPPVIEVTFRKSGPQAASEELR